MFYGLFRSAAQVVSFIVNSGEKIIFLDPVFSLLSIQYICLHMYVMAIAYLITGPISAVVNTFPNKRLLNYSFKEQLEDLVPYIGLSLFMGFIVWPVQYLPIGNIVIIILQVILGAIIYVIGSRLFRLDMFFELINMIRRKR